MKKLENLLPLGIGLLIAISLIALTGIPENKNRKIGETQTITKPQVKNSEMKGGDYLLLSGVGLSYAFGAGIYSRHYIKNSLTNRYK